MRESEVATRITGTSTRRSKWRFPSWRACRARDRERDRCRNTGRFRKVRPVPRLPRWRDTGTRAIADCARLPMLRRRQARLSFGGCEREKISAAAMRSECVPCAAPARQKEQQEGCGAQNCDEFWNHVVAEKNAREQAERCYGDQDSSRREAGLSGPIRKWFLRRRAPVQRQAARAVLPGAGFA